MENHFTSIKTSKIELAKVQDDALLIGFFKDKLSLTADLAALDNSLYKIISSYIRDNGFKGEKSEAKSIYVGKNVKNIVLVGLGEEEKFGLDVLLSAIADASKRLRDNGTASFSIFLKSFVNNKFKEEEIVEKIVLSSLMGLYKFTEYKTKDKDKIKFIKNITIITSEKDQHVLLQISPHKHT